MRRPQQHHSDSECALRSDRTKACDACCRSEGSKEYARFRAVLDRALVMTGYLGRRPPVPLLLFVVNFERHIQDFFVLALVGFESVEPIRKILFFVE